MTIEELCHPLDQREDHKNSCITWILQHALWHVMYECGMGHNKLENKVPHIWQEDLLNAQRKEDHVRQSLSLSQQYTILCVWKSLPFHNKMSVVMYMKKNVNVRFRIMSKDGKRGKQGHMTYGTMIMFLELQWAHKKWGIQQCRDDQCIIYHNCN